MAFRADYEEEVEVLVHLFHYPGWQARSDVAGRLPLALDPATGGMYLTIPPGPQVITVDFKTTAPRSYAAILSIAALAVLVGLLLIRRAPILRRTGP